ncbi:hypothetical protein ACP70R_031174 [Stipagrostis hirtigluma subsp. patula]
MRTTKHARLSYDSCAALVIPSVSPHSSCSSSSLVRWAEVLQMADPRLRGEADCREDVLLACFRLAFACCAIAPGKLPAMSDAVLVLKNGGDGTLRRVDEQQRHSLTEKSCSSSSIRALPPSPRPQPPPPLPPR